MQPDRIATKRRMTSSQSRLLTVGARVCWRDDNNDQGTVTEKDWAWVTLQWDNRTPQSVLHNDMAGVGIVAKK
jgi:hypothetical protein